MTDEEVEEDEAVRLRFILDGGGHVYLLFDEITRIYKIGSSNQVRIRLAMFGAATLNPLRLIWYISTNDHKRLEKWWKQRWHANLVRGDWYGLKDSEICDFKFAGAVRFLDLDRDPPVGNPFAIPKRKGPPRIYEPIQIGGLLRQLKVK